MNTFDKALRQVINDTQSGSVAVLQQLIRGIQAYLARAHDPGTSLKVIHDRLPLMTESLSHFAVVNHFLNQLTEVLSRYQDHSSRSGELADFVKQYEQIWKNVNEKVADTAFRNLEYRGRTILLHSNSSAVVSLFSRLKNAGISVHIIQTESRPENEGRNQAKTIAGMGFEVRFVVDAAAASMLHDVDMMITGADQVHPDYFVNKIGTYPLALACRDKGVPLYVLADSRKISLRPADPESLHNIQKPGSDIWKPGIDNIRPVNFYFESIPGEFVRSFFTESRVTEPSQIVRPD